MPLRPPTIEQILNPATIAVIGASESADKFGGRVLHHLLKHGYEGRILPINPARKTLLGLKAYPNVKAAPPADLAILALPVAALVQAISDCAEAGVGCCVVITSQLAEVGEEGKALQDEIVAIARRANMRIVGPNCLGIINPPHRMALTASFAMAIDRLPSGGIGLVSQSGALMATMFSRGHDIGAGFRACVSVGNQADLGICDFLEYMVGDPETKVVCLYMEGLTEADRFFALADRARKVGKPVLAVKAGRSAAGGKVARSHTASLLGSYQAFAAACRDHGVILVDDPEGMILCADAIARMGRPSRGGIAVISGSGGGAAIAADRIEGAGLPLAGLGEASVTALSDLLPTTHRHLPLDLGALSDGWIPALCERAMRIVMEDPGVSVGLYLMTMQPLMSEITEALTRIMADTGKPVLMTLTAGEVGRGPGEIFAKAAFPSYDRLDDSLRVAGALVQSVPFSASEVLLTFPDITGQVGAALDSFADPRLTEPEAKALLRAAGVRTTREEVVRSRDGLTEATARIGFPVVLKLVSREVSHKSDIGGVKLNLRNLEEAKAAWDEIAAAMARQHPPATLDACLIQEMAGGVAELILGATWDEELGPVVLVGAGGIFVEILRDIEMARAPVTRGQADAMLRRLKYWPILAGARGRPAGDVEAVIDAVVSLGQLSAVAGPRLRELDINPLIVGRQDAGAIAVDARATLDLSKTGD